MLDIIKPKQNFIMKKIYSILAASALFAVGANAQPIVAGTHDMALIPFVGQEGMTGQPGKLFKVGETPDGFIDPATTDFFIAVYLVNNPSTDNEIPGSPYYMFIDNSFNPGPGYRGIGYNSNVPFDPASAQEIYSDGTLGMRTHSYPNAVEFSDGGREQGHVADFTTSADSLMRVIDLDAYENNEEEYFMDAQDMVNGQLYGFFYDIIAYATVTDGSMSAIYEDVDPSNNMVIFPMLWTQGVSIGEMVNEASKQKLAIYPNPVQESFSFDHVFGAPTKNVTINVLDITGKVVLSQEEATPSENLHRYSVDASSLAAGTYVVQLVTDSYTATAKFIKK